MDRKNLSFEGIDDGEIVELTNWIDKMLRISHQSWIRIKSRTSNVRLSMKISMVYLLEDSSTYGLREINHKTTWG
jgi:hypothetical protein